MGKNKKYRSAYQSFRKDYAEYRRRKLKDETEISEDFCSNDILITPERVILLTVDNFNGKRFDDKRNALKRENMLTVEEQYMFIQNYFYQPNI